MLSILIALCVENPKAIDAIELSVISGAMTLMWRHFIHSKFDILKDVNSKYKAPISEPWVVPFAATKPIWNSGESTGLSYGLFKMTDNQLGAFSHIFLRSLDIGFISMCTFEEWISNYMHIFALLTHYLTSKMVGINHFWRYGIDEISGIDEYFFQCFKADLIMQILYPILIKLLSNI